MHTSRTYRILIAHWRYCVGSTSRKKWLRQARRLLKWMLDHRHDKWDHRITCANLTLICYADASHNDDLDDCGTTVASVVFHNDTCLDARSKKRNIVTGSVAANEERAIHEPLNEIRPMHALLKAAGFTFDEPPGIASDNAAPAHTRSVSPCASDSEWPRLSSATSAWACRGSASTRSPPSASSPSRHPSAFGPFTR